MVTLEVKLHKNQREIFDDPHRFKIICCGRRFGKTWLAAYIVTVSAIQKPKGTYFLVSPNYSQTSIIWRMIKNIIPMEIVEKIMEGDKYILLKNGACIYAKSGDNPDSLRGEGLDGVVMDEYAMLKSEVWTEAIRPALSDKQGWAVFISTPKGKNHFFHLFLRGTRPDESAYKSFHFTSYDNPFIARSELEEMVEQMPELIYDQEILAKFIEGGGTVFKNFEARLANCLEEPKAGHLYSIGVDLGRTVDFTVITVGDLSTNTVVYIERFNKTSWDFIKGRIKDVCMKYNRGTVYIDSSGAGDPIYEDLAKEMPIYGIDFKMQNKTFMINNLALLLENNVVTLPKDDELIVEFQAYTYKISPQGNIQYTAPDGFHDDIVISVALCTYGMGSGMASCIGVIGEEDDAVTTDYDEIEDIVDYDLEDDNPFIPV
jgi:phage FluMu gp28-like protein